MKVNAYFHHMMLFVSSVIQPLQMILR